MRAASLLAFLALAATPAAARPLNLLLVSIDTLNRSALRAFAPDAPALPGYDALATQSLRFANAYSTSSWTLPAHGSLMTGLYPWHHGGSQTTARVSAPTTLAAELRRRGYRTVALTDGGFVEWSFGFLPGFDFYDGATDGPGWPEGGSLPHRGGHDPEAVVVDPFDRGRAFLTRQGDGDPPFFLFLHTYLVHDYFRPRECDAAVMSAPPGLERSGYDCLQLQPCDLSWEDLRRRYAEEVAQGGRALAALLATVEAAGLAPQTMVVLTSDHGEGFAPEIGRIHHGRRLHEDQVRVPLLVRAPGLAPGDVAAPISLVDLMPTLLAALGAPVPDGLDGRVLPLSPDAPATGPRFAGLARRREPASAAVIDGPWWFIAAPQGEELYDMRDDPGQRHDRAASSPELPRLKALLRQAGVWQAAAPAPRTLDAATRERLRALGY